MTFPRSWRWPAGRLAAVFVVLVVASAFGEHWRHVATTALISAIAAVGVALVVARVGMVSLGHAAFYAAGAYTSAILTRDHGWPLPLGITAAAGVGALSGAIVGPLALRTRGIAFVMVTLAAGELMRVFATQARGVTGGDTGLSGVPPIKVPVGSAVAAGALVAVLVLCWWLLGTVFGRGIDAARQDERKAAALGFDVTVSRAVLFVLSAATVALAGALLAHHSTFVSPSLARWSMSGHLLVMVLIGGGRAITGAVAGAVGLTFLEEVVVSRSDRWQLVLGCLFIAVVLTGIVGGRRPMRRRPPRAAPTALGDAAGRARPVAVR